MMRKNRTGLTQMQAGELSRKGYEQILSSDGNQMVMRWVYTVVKTMSGCPLKTWIYKYI